MYPLLKNGQKILCLSKFFCNFKEDDIVIFNQNKYGMMIKKIQKIVNDEFYVKGTSYDSIDSSIFGRIKKEKILYKMVYIF